MSHVKYSAEVAGDVLCPHNEGSFLRNEGHTGKSTGKRWRETKTEALCPNKISSLESQLCEQFYPFLV